MMLRGLGLRRGGCGARAGFGGCGAGSPLPRGCWGRWGRWAQPVPSAHGGTPTLLIQCLQEHGRPPQHCPPSRPTLSPSPVLTLSPRPQAAARPPGTMAQVGHRVDYLAGFCCPVGGLVAGKPRVLCHENQIYLSNGSEFVYVYDQEGKVLKVSGLPGGSGAAVPWGWCPRTGRSWRDSNRVTGRPVWGQSLLWGPLSPKERPEQHQTPRPSPEAPPRCCRLASLLNLGDKRSIKPQRLFHFSLTKGFAVVFV